MKSVLFASLLASAAAFAPAPTSPRAQMALRDDLSGEIGATAPLGFFDPLNVANEDKGLFDELRYVELKHGRVAMLAVVGYLTTYAGNRFPGCENVESGFGALKTLKGEGFLFVLATCLILEIWNSDITGESEFKGDFRNGLDFGWDKQTDEWKIKKRTIEINNGRAAMMGILGLMVHDAMGNIGDILP